MSLWCVGRNYAEHARELGNEVPSEPMIFLKSAGCLTRGRGVQWTATARDVHHELEIALEFDADLRFRVLALALDLTERTLQGRLKDKGHPWTLAKSFTGACPISDPVPLPAAGLGNLRLQLHVNGELRQDGSTSQMIFTPETLREFLIARVPVREGHWLLTGTPAGVGPLRAGDELAASLTTADGTSVLQTNWTVHPPK